MWDARLPWLVQSVGMDHPHRVAGIVPMGHIPRYPIRRIGVFGDMGLQTQILEEPYYGDIQGVPDL
jgi:hypothetical protein